MFGRKERAVGSIVARVSCWASSLYLAVGDSVQARDPKVIKHTMLVDKDRGAENDHEREYNREHRTQRHYKGSERNANDCKNDDHRDDHCHGEELVDSVLNIVPESTPGTASILSVRMQSRTQHPAVKAYAHVLASVQQIVGSHGTTRALCAWERRLHGLRPRDPLL
jgi:hypothetical protein